MFFRKTNNQLSFLPSPTANRCDHNRSNFELLTGYVYSSSSDTIATIPGTLRLSDCLSTCRSNSSCRSLNFETGLCILFNSSAYDRPSALSRSQFPVFTFYAQKVCLPMAIDPSCQQSWLFETVPDHVLRGFEARKLLTASKLDCMAKCFAETQFQCRSANYIAATNECTLSKMDRHSIASLYQNQNRQFVSLPGHDYLESNCVDGKYNYAINRLLNVLIGTSSNNVLSRDLQLSL